MVETLEPSSVGPTDDSGTQGAVYCQIHSGRNRDNIVLFVKVTTSRILKILYQCGPEPTMTQGFYLNPS